MEVIDLSDDSPTQPRKKLKTDNVIVLSDDENGDATTDEVAIDNILQENTRETTPIITKVSEEETTQILNGKENQTTESANQDLSISTESINKEEQKQKEVEVNQEESKNLVIEDKKTEEGANDDNLLVILKEEPYKPEEKSPASTSTERQALPIELESFINLCKDHLPKNISELKLRNKLKSIKLSAQRAINYVNSKAFTDELQRIQAIFDQDAKKSSECLVKLYQLLITKADEEPNEIEVNERHQQKLDDLYDKLGKVKTRISELELEEVDFEKEDNSSFMKHQKYLEKAAQILAAIAKLENHSQYDGQVYFSRLDFDKSTIDEFNVALNKKYRNREKHTFPTFGDVDKCLRRCAKKNNLELGETKLKSEIEFCFKEFGKLLKKRRQKDLRIVHHHYLADLQDPAAQDAELERKLRDNRKHAKTKMDEMLEKFTGLQEANVEPEVSADSDDSEPETDSEED